MPFIDRLDIVGAAGGIALASETQSNFIKLIAIVNGKLDANNLAASQALPGSPDTGDIPQWDGSAWVSIPVPSGGSGSAFVLTKDNLFPIMRHMIQGTGIGVSVSTHAKTITLTKKAPSEKEVYDHVKDILIGGAGLTFSPITSIRRITIAAEAVDIPAGQKFPESPDTNDIPQWNGNAWIAIPVPTGGMSVTPTEANVYPLIKDILVAGTGISLAVDDTNNNLTLSKVAPTEVEVYNHVKDILVGGGDINLSLTSSTRRISVAVDTPVLGLQTSYWIRPSNLDQSSVNALLITVDNLTAGSYIAGTQFSFFAEANNTGEMTAKVNTNPAKALTHADDKVMRTNQFVSGSLVTILFNGTDFKLVE